MQLGAVSPTTELGNDTNWLSSRLLPAMPPDEEESARRVGLREGHQDLCRSLQYPEGLRSCPVVIARDTGNWYGLQTRQISKEVWAQA
eukprot:gene13160-biopygen1832